MKISKESKVGVLVAIAIAILAVGYNFMKGEDIFTTSNEYYGKYKKIEGLFKSNPVLINGYKVGSVSSVLYSCVLGDLKQQSQFSRRMIFNI